MKVITQTLLSLKFALERYDKMYTNKAKKFLLIGNMLELENIQKNYILKSQNISIGRMFLRPLFMEIIPNTHLTN